MKNLNPGTYPRLGIILATLALIIAILAIVIPYCYLCPKFTVDVNPLIHNQFKQTVLIVIKNEGHAKATNVEIYLSAKGEITNPMAEIQLIGKKTAQEELFLEKVTFNIENSTCALKTLRINHGTQIKILLEIKSESDFPINKIIIISDEKNKRINFEQIENNLFQNIVSFSIGVCCTLVSPQFNP